LASANSAASIKFGGSTGTLILDHSSSFTGTIYDLTGNGNLSGSDQIDLKDITFGAGTTESYSGNSSGGVLKISDAQGQSASISLFGNYTNSTFTLSSDGHGGTIVIDPPIGVGDFTGNGTEDILFRNVNLPTGATLNDAAGDVANLSGAVTTFPGLSIDPNEQLALFVQNMASAFPSSAFAEGSLPTISSPELGSSQLAPPAQPVAHQ
jgi:hypothetical protein